MKLRVLILLIVFVFFVATSYVPFVGANPGYEDFTSESWLEVDPNSRINASSATHIDTTIDRNEEAYMYQDYGVDHFSDFVHFLDVSDNSTAPTADFIFFWCLSNDLDDFKGLVDNNKTAIGANFYDMKSEGTRRMAIQQAYNTSRTNDATDGLTLGQMYYLRLQKNGTSLTCGIWTDSTARDNNDAEDASYIDGLTLTLDGDWSFRYLMIVTAYNSGTANSQCNVDIENLDLNEADTQAPLWQNQGPSNGTTTDGELNLTAQGKDDVGLDQAWLSTNETGSWQNYTSGFTSIIEAGNYTLYSGNPLVISKSRYATSVWKDGDYYYEFHCFGNDIVKWVSTDGVNFVSNGTCLTPEQVGDWANYYLSTPMVWKEDSTWYMMFRGVDLDDNTRIGLANCTDSGSPDNWTVDGDNPIIVATEDWEFSNHNGTGTHSVENWGIMKVNSTYYLWYNNMILGEYYRSAGLATTTDSPEHWTNSSFTKDVNNPIFNGEGSEDEWDNYFCCFPFVCGDTYYLLVCRDQSVAGTGPLRIDLWRDTEPTFYNTSRVYIGLAINGTEGSMSETPCVLTTDITRSDFVDDVFRVYFGDRKAYDILGWLKVTNLASESLPYGSPLDMTGVSPGTWGWSNFTWGNSSISAGTTVAWRIYYNDTSGNVNVTDIHTFTVAGAINIKVLDYEGNILTSAVVFMNNGTQYNQTVSAGWANWTVSVSEVTVYVTWKGITVNASHTLAAGTHNLSCTAYPYSLSGSRFWVASNATISSTSWVDPAMTISFSDSVDTYILVASSSTKPSYVLNCSYNYATDFDSYLTLTHHANTTIEINYESWGDTYIQRCTERLVDVSFSDQKLRMYIEGAVTGSLEIKCGGRGNPQTNFGFSAFAYNASTTVFSGTVSFESQVYCWVDWTTGSSGGDGGPGGPGGTISSLITDFPEQMLEPIYVGRCISVNLTFSFDRASVIYIENVSFGDYQGWFTLPSFPIRVSKVSEGEETVTIPISVCVPRGARAREYTIPCTLILKDDQTLHSLHTTLQFIASEPPGIPDYMAFVFAGVIGLFFVGTMVWKKRH